MEVRRKEQRVLAKFGFMVSIFNSLVPIGPVFAGALTFATTAASGGSLPPAAVYSTLALFEMMRYALGTVPLGVRVSRREVESGSDEDGPPIFYKSHLLPHSYSYPQPFIAVVRIQSGAAAH